MVVQARMDDRFRVAPVPEVVRLARRDAAPVVAAQAGIKDVLGQLRVVVEAEVVVVDSRHQRRAVRLPFAAVGVR